MRGRNMLDLLAQNATQVIVRLRENEMLVPYRIDNWGKPSDRRWLPGT